MMSKRTSDTPARARGGCQPELGEARHLAALARRDGVFGRAARARAARLDLDEGQDAGRAER